MKKHSTSQPASWAPTRQVAPAPARRPDGTFRFSDRFIKMATTVLITFMLVSVTAGFVTGALSDTVDRGARDALVIAAGALIIGGFVLPLLLAAVLGGEAIRAGGGFIGFFLIAGLLAAVAGGTELGQEMLGRDWTPWAFWGGIALMGLATGSFWIVGWIARVPMWLQAPVLGSPRVVVRGSSDNPADIVLPNELDERRT
ncbi:hypothetical protein [Arthrobacter sp.]|uniref:hypothetical protein n=1 Tax=Arthrobacter sp. TaxID=1667 RepID=UPI00339B060F